MALTQRESAFVDAYLTEFNGLRAMLTVKPSLTPGSAGTIATRLLKKVEVQAEIVRRALALREVTELEARDLTRMWAQIATVDRNEIAEVQRVCCPWCWSPNDDPQETPGQRSARRRDYDFKVKQITARAKEGQPLILPDFPELGGVGYDVRKPINPSCAECFGDGQSRLVVKDTRKLSPAARAVYEGVDIKNGDVVVKMHSREKALELIARKLGMLKDGANGAPPGSSDEAMRNVTSDDPQEASRVYLRMIEGS
jgi:hypothetical protein